jgi:hypothetical protein
LCLWTRSDQQIEHGSNPRLHAHSRIRWMM